MALSLPYVRFCHLTNISSTNCNHYWWASSQLTYFLNFTTTFCFHIPACTKFVIDKWIDWITAVLKKRKFVNYLAVVNFIKFSKVSHQEPITCFAFNSLDKFSLSLYSYIRVDRALIDAFTTLFYNHNFNLNRTIKRELSIFVIWFFLRKNLQYKVISCGLRNSPDQWEMKWSLLVIW